MFVERPVVPPIEPHAAPPDAVASFAILGTDFVEVLALFVRTIPLYPDGHGRVVAVSDRLAETAAALSAPVVIEVADRGLVVNGDVRSELPPGPKVLRDALLSTAVVRVVIQPTTPASSYVAFARTLQRNARLAGSAHLSFAELWTAPIAGVEVHELLFGSEGFSGAGGDGEPGADKVAILGSTGEAGDAPLSTARPDVRAGVARPRVRTFLTASKDLRDLVLEDPALSTELARLESHLVDDGVQRTRSGVDVLEHLVRALPIEARLDSTKGLEVIRRVMARMLDSPTVTPAADAKPDLATRFFQTLESVFPKRVRAPEAAQAAGDAPEIRAEGSPLENLLQFDDALFDDWSGARDEEPPAIPELGDDDGIVDPSAILLHSFLEEPQGARRDTLRQSLLEAYATRTKGSPAPCLMTHLFEAMVAVPRDDALVECLAGVVDDARIELPAGSSPLTLDLTVALFPRCLATYVRSGGRVGPIARRIGRDGVLAHAARFTAPGGLLSGDCLERVFAERSLDALPFVEALFLADPSSRARVVRALRVLDLKSLAAVALRVVPESRFPDRFLSELCADGFEGRDSTQLLGDAALSLGSVVVDKEGILDTTTRVYATAALGSFPAALAEAPLRAVVARKLIGSAPKEVRRAAEGVLERFARQASEAREVP